jgi:hypothetical protein
MIKIFNQEDSESGKQEKTGDSSVLGRLTRSPLLTRVFGLPVDVV